MAKSKILVIGSIMTDLVVRSQRVPKPGETLHGTGFFRAFGGKGANQAIAAFRAGAEVDFLGAVGDDDFGRATLENLTLQGVDASRCRTVSGSHSGVALITLDANAENTIIVAPGANESLDPSALDGIEWSHYSAVVLQLEIFQETVWQAIRASAPHTKIFLTPAPVRTVPAGILDCVDYLIPNEHEILPLVAEETQKMGMEAAAREVASMVRCGVALTLGAAGVRWFGHNGEEFSVPAPKVEPVDTVGAGDCFSGYFVQGISAGLPLRDALARACQAASMQVTREGAQTAIPTAIEVLRTADTLRTAGLAEARNRQPQLK